MNILLLTFVMEAKCLKQGLILAFFRQEMVHEMQCDDAEQRFRRNVATAVSNWCHSFPPLLSGPTAYHEIPM